MFKIALASDLHLEFADIELKNTAGADVLVLSGDIMIAEELHSHKHIDYDPYTPGALSDLGRKQQMAVRYREFLKRCSTEFPHTVMVAGNHEFYHGRWSGSIAHLREECAEFPNVYFLENDTKDLGEYTLIGCTLWTDCNKGDPLTMHALTDLMNDYKVIRNDDHGFTKLRPAHTMDRHRKSKEYIRLAVSGLPDKKFVVVGHHTPSILSVNAAYRNDQLMNGGYYSDLSDFILDRPQIKLWTCGHTHHVHRYYLGDTLVACNPRGYAGWDSGASSFNLKYIDLDNMPSKFDGVDWEWNGL